jgi:hypothetical protein
VPLSAPIPPKGLALGSGRSPCAGRSRGGRRRRRPREPSAPPRPTAALCLTCGSAGALPGAPADGRRAQPARQVWRCRAAGHSARRGLGAFVDRLNGYRWRCPVWVFDRDLVAASGLRVPKRGLHPMSEADRVFPRQEFPRRDEQGAQTSSGERRLILSAPRRGRFGGAQSRVVEVVHVRRGRSRPTEGRSRPAAGNVRAETWPEGFRARSAGMR